MSDALEKMRELHRSVVMQVPDNRDYADALARVLAVAEQASIAVTWKFNDQALAQLLAAVAALRGGEGE